VLQDGLLYVLISCVPVSSVLLLFLQEAHGGDLMGHFGVKKIEDVLAAHFFWPKMRRDVECYVSQCTTLSYPGSKKHRTEASIRMPKMFNHMHSKI
jgi:hypothetical protein